MEKSRRMVLMMLLLLAAGLVNSQGTGLTLEEYIAKYRGLAVEEMHLYNIPASVTLAQGILESANGNSTLARQANNHFGIKCHKGWTGETFKWDDDHAGECFRKYGSSEDSYRDHSLFLTTRDRYSFLFDLPAEDYKAWAHGLKQAGYATNPRYPDLLIRIIEENRLFELDSSSPGEEIAAREDQNKREIPAKAEGSSTSFREIHYTNHVPYIIARQGDTDVSIASEFNINAWQVRKYNEKEKKGKKSEAVYFREGEVVFLEARKKKAGKGVPASHTVAPGEDMGAIGRLYGIWTESLYKLNGIDPDSLLKKGQRIRLK